MTLDKLRKLISTGSSSEKIASKTLNNVDTDFNGTIVDVTVSGNNALFL